MITYNKYVQFFQWQTLQAQKLTLLKKRKIIKQPNVLDFNNKSLSSSPSSKSLWARSYKNQPIPAQLRKRLMGKKYQFDDIDDGSSSDEQIMAVLQEEQQQQIEEKTRLPKFKVMSDCDEFSDTRRCRINLQKNRYSPLKCQSVSSLKLPQVIEQKKEEDDIRNKKNVLTKIEQFRDNNEFGLNYHRISSCDPTEVRSRGKNKFNKAQSMQLPKTTKLMEGFPEEIIQNQGEESKSLKNYHEKSILTTELQKLIVDEVDEQEKKRKQEVSPEQIEAIEEEKAEEEVDIGKLSQLRGRFEEQVTNLEAINDQYIQKPGFNKPKEIRK